MVRVEGRESKPLRIYCYVGRRCREAGKGWVSAKREVDREIQVKDSKNEKLNSVRESDVETPMHHLAICRSAVPGRAIGIEVSMMMSYGS